MISALMLGRKGSVGFPGKNLFPVLGRPLSWYPLNAALKCPQVDRVFVSTDDERLAQLAESMGASTISRPAHLCSKTALGEDAYKHGCDVIREQLGNPELFVFLFANAPTVSSEQISEGIAILRKHPEYDSAVTVSRYNMWSPLRARRIGEDGLLHPFVPLETFKTATLTCDRDSQGDAWFADVAMCVVRPANMEKLEEGVLPQKWMGKKIYPIMNEAGLDVDYVWQLGQAEWWLRQHGHSEAQMEAASEQGNK